MADHSGGRAPAMRGWPTLGWRQTVLLATWIGLVCGFCEVAHMEFCRFVLAEMLKQSEHLVWLAPTCFVVAFAVIGVVVGTLARALPRLAALPVVVFVLVSVAGWSHLLLFPWIHGVARVVVSGAIALVAARWAVGHSAVLHALRQRTLPWLVGLLLLAALAVPSCEALSEQRALAGLPAPPARAPNVLLIVVDTLRADHLPVYGYQRPTTPHIDAWAQDAIVFERLVSTSPWTLPSHATMFTGRYPFENTASWLTPLNGEHTTLAEVFAAHGYATAGFVGNLDYCPRETGLARGFSHYEDYYLDGRTIARSTALGRKLLPRLIGEVAAAQLAKNTARTVTEQFMRWLPSTEGRPFFAFLNLIDAHAPHILPERVASVFGEMNGDYETWGWKNEWSDSELTAFVDCYDSCIAYVDYYFDRVLRGLREQGLYDDTLIILTSDHGEHLGEHGLTSHGNSLYWPLLHLPLILHCPGRLPSAVRVPDAVSLRDLPATILDVALGAPGALPGVSLAGLWRDDDDGLRTSPLLSQLRAGVRTPPWEPHTAGDMHSLIVGDLHLIINGDGSEEMYGFAADPAAAHDLLESPAGATRAQAIRKELLRLRQ